MLTCFLAEYYPSFLYTFVQLYLHLHFSFMNLRLYSNDFNMK